MNVSVPSKPTGGLYVKLPSVVFTLIFPPLVEVEGAEVIVKVPAPFGFRSFANTPFAIGTLIPTLPIDEKLSLTAIGEAITEPAASVVML